MEYALAMNEGPDTIKAGTGLLLFHPSTGETDRIDTDFFKEDTDAFLVISTRTTAREVEQKLEFYDVDESSAVILDTLSVERGYSRRPAEHIHYVSSPDDLGGILECTRRFLESHDGKRRVSVDSITELSYYTEDEEAVFEVMTELLALLREFDAVGLFHLSPEVHNQELLARYQGTFDGTINLSEDGEVDVSI